MTSTWLRALPRFLLQAPRLTLLAAATVTLATTFTACGGGGYTESPLSVTDRRSLSDAFLTRASVSYSPYRSSRSEADLGSEVITAANVLQDLRLIQATGIGTIRLFSSRGFAETVLQVIRDNNLDLRVQLGAYPNSVTSAAAEADNQAELDRCIVLANRYASIIDAVSVGNETMVSWTTHPVAPATMGAYLRKVRQAITQPVTTNDNWAFWASAPKTITDVVDFAAVHAYPFLDTHYNPTLYDWQQKSVAANQRAAAMVKATVDEAKRQFAAARDGLDKLNLLDLPMVIGETGWAAVDTTGGPNLSFRASPVNQKMYFDALQAWASEGRRTREGPKAIFFFQAFDEPWKQGDDGWGLFNTNRQARYVVQGLGTCGVTWTCEPGSYTLADAVKWIAPTVAAAVSSSRYTLYADVAVTGETRATGMRWDPFGSTGYRDDTSTSAPGDGNTSFEITPNPLNYGWGLFQHATSGATQNLSSFEASGRLVFSVKSDSYPGKIEIGISSDTEDREVQEAYLRVGPGDFGYCNTNRWCEVSIPLSAFKAANPKIDFRLLSFQFIIADRYSFTGKPLNTVGLPKISVDNIRYTR